MLALALGRRQSDRIEWASCCTASSLGEEPVRRSVDRFGSPIRDGAIHPSELALARVDLESLDRLVASSSPESRARLIELLRLPPLLQEALQAGNGAAALVMARLDALPDELITACFGCRWVHDALHHAGLSLVATYSGRPSAAFAAEFDRVFRIEQLGSGRWSEAFVWSERGPTEIDLLLPQPLRSVWAGMRFDARLLEG